MHDGGAEQVTRRFWLTGARQVTFGDACTILAGASIGDQANLGRDVVLGPRSTVCLPTGIFSYGLPLLVARVLASCSRGGAWAALLSPDSCRTSLG